MRDCDRVARISRDLKALSTQFHWNAFQESTVNEQASILNGLLNSGLVEDLRTAVDYLTHFLWRYIECAAANAGPDADYELQNERLVRMTEMLRLLHHSSCPSQSPVAFVERVTQSVDRCLEMAGQDEMLCESRPSHTASKLQLEEPRVARTKAAARRASAGRMVSSWR